MKIVKVITNFDENITCGGAKEWRELSKEEMMQGLSMKTPSNFGHKFGFMSDDISVIEKQIGDNTLINIKDKSIKFELYCNIKLII